MSSKDKQASIAHRLAASKPKEATQEHELGDETVVPRKRRKQSETTVNACNACRRKRTKCDGNEPCSKCSSHPGSECTYEINTRVSKEEMKREIIDLRRSNSIAMRILNSLAADREVPRILAELRAQNDLSSIARLTESSPAPESEAILEDSPLPEERGETSYNSLTDTSPRGSQPSHAAGKQPWLGFIRAPSTTVNPNSPDPWRTPLVNDLLIKHLLSLYWVWIHPAHPILNMARFFEDYENRGSTYCSAYLVNAVCAAACDLLNPEWEEVPGKSTDVAALKQHLVAEATIQAALADPEAPTTQQASAIIAFLNTLTAHTSPTGF
ncbi:MAG: hypothetical protein FRX48_07361 [Lasallia pustulata]|uniref:Zn(2)-C6 fungal-type domain-containing protein n=1 Tax=Lasallia pustulata TaxID=136370 RepID=A0A5M8PI05_9LECA|nr:MAG: hypothetical protein FRX48_07361 [Lasallia pustulata]